MDAVEEVVTAAADEVVSAEVVSPTSPLFGETLLGQSRSQATPCPVTLEPGGTERDAVTSTTGSLSSSR